MLSLDAKGWSTDDRHPERTAHALRPQIGERSAARMEGVAPGVVWSAAPSECRCDDGGVPCPVCTSPETTYPCARCLSTFAARRRHTSTDLRDGLTRIAEVAADVTTETTYVGPDGPRRLIRELYLRSGTCALGAWVSNTPPGVLG